MKKHITIICLLFIVSTKFFAQNNLTWTFLGKHEKGAIKTTTVFQTKLTGFKSIQEANKAINILKTSTDVKSCLVSNSDNLGNCDLVLTMKAAHDKKYYLAFAQKMGVSYIVNNEIKKSVVELLAGKNKK